MAIFDLRRKIRERYRDTDLALYNVEDIERKIDRQTDKRLERRQINRTKTIKIQ